MIRIRLSRVLGECRWTQEELAVKLEKSKQLISLYEADKRRPPYETLEAIADLFNVPMHTFLTKEEQEKAIRDQYASMGIAAHIVTVDDDKPRKTALDKIIDQLTEYRDAMPYGLRPDEERMLQDYRMLNSKQRQRLQMFIDAMLDNDM